MTRDPLFLLDCAQICLVICTLLMLTVKLNANIANNILLNKIFDGALVGLIGFPLLLLIELTRQYLETM